MKGLPWLSWYVWTHFHLSLLQVVLIAAGIWSLVYVVVQMVGRAKFQRRLTQLQKESEHGRGDAS